MISSSSQAKQAERIRNNIQIKANSQIKNNNQVRYNRRNKIRLLFALLYNSCIDIAVIGIGIICISNLMMYDESGICSAETINNKQPIDKTEPGGQGIVKEPETIKKVEIVKQAKTNKQTKLNEQAKISKQLEITRNPVDFNDEYRSIILEFQDGYGEADASSDYSYIRDNSLDKPLYKFDERFDFKAFLAKQSASIEKINNDDRIKTRILAISLNAKPVDLFDLDFVGAYTIRILATSNMSTTGLLHGTLCISLFNVFGARIDYPFILNHLFIEHVNLYMNIRSKLTISYVSKYQVEPIVHVKAKFEVRTVGYRLAKGCNQ